VNKRFSALILVFALNVAVTFLVSLLPVDTPTGIAITERVETMREIVNTEGLGVPYIFGNNLMITLPSFIPLAGIGWFLVLAYNNGVAISAVNIPFTVFLMPYFVLEYMASSIAVVEGTWVISDMMSKKPTKEIVERVLRNIGICSVVLFLSAIIEMVI